MYYIGIDIGSISVDTAILDKSKNIIEDRYIRSYGQPLQTAIKTLKNIFDKYPQEKIAGIANDFNLDMIVLRKYFEAY